MISQMKVFALLVIVSLLGVAPVVAFESIVMPQISDMHETYASFDEIAEDVAAGDQINAQSLRQN